MGITKPPAYEHPRKRNRRASGDQTDTATPVAKPAIPIREKKDERGGRQTDKQIRLSQSKETVRVVAYEPSPGALPQYDDMIAGGIETKAALLGLLRKARTKIDELIKRPRKSVDKLDYVHS